MYLHRQLTAKLKFKNDVMKKQNDRYIKLYWEKKIDVEEFMEQQPRDKEKQLSTKFWYLASQKQVEHREKIGDGIMKTSLEH